MSALAEIVPLAGAIALSPGPVLPAILLLFTARPRATAGAFLAGWTIGILAIVVLLSSIATYLEGGATPTWAPWLRIALGTALVVLGVRTWLGRAAKAAPPGWLTGLDDADPARAARMGLLLAAANPKNLALAVAAGLAIGAHESTALGFLGVVGVFTLIASSTAALPVLLLIVRGDRVLERLRRAKDWLLAHHVAVVAVVVVAIGAAVLLKGVSGL